MRIGAVSLGWSGTPLREVFTQLAAAGGECLELNGNAAKHHGIELTSRTAPLVKSWAAQHGLVIGSISGYSDFAQPDADALQGQIDRLLAHCRAAAELEVAVVRAFVGEPKDGLTFGNLRQQVIASFQQAAAAAAELGVSLAIENHGRLLNDGAALAALVRDIAAPNVGLTIDTGNFAWSGRDPQQTSDDVGAALPHALNVHVKDGIWRDSGFEFVPAGDGELDLVTPLVWLRQRGFVGMVYSEYEGAGGFLEGTRRSIAYLRSVLANDVTN